MATKTTKPARKITIKQALNQIATGAKPSNLYAGEPIQATRLFMKNLDAYENTTAVCYMALNEVTNTATYCNAYAAKGSDAAETMPRSSYDPATYTYPIKPKVIDKKMNEMIELERPENWPSFVVPATRPTETNTPARRGRKPAAM